MPILREAVLGTTRIQSKRGEARRMAQAILGGEPEGFGDDPTSLAPTTRFDEENFEKTLRLWAGITFPCVPVQSRRV
jgi:hypothetical protein